LYIWKPDGTLYYNITNTTAGSTAEVAERIFVVSGIPENKTAYYSWNCLAYDNNSNSAWAVSNYTFLINTHPTVGPGQDFENLTACLKFVNDTTTPCNITYGSLEYIIDNAYHFTKARIEISANNVTMNCNFSTFEFGNSGYGIKINPHIIGTEIKNCFIKGYNAGIFIENNTSNVIIDNVHVNDSIGTNVAQGCGIVIGYYKSINYNITIQNSYFSNNSVAGIGTGRKLANVPTIYNLTIKNVTTRNTNIGIKLEAHLYNTTIDNTILTYNMYKGLYVIVGNLSGLEVKNSVIKYNDEEGFYLAGGLQSTYNLSDIEVDNCTLSHNVKENFKLEGVHYLTNFLLKNSVIENSSTMSCIYLSQPNYQEENVTIENNKIINCKADDKFGIEPSGNQPNLVTKDNHFENNSCHAIINGFFINNTFNKNTDTNFAGMGIASGVVLGNHHHLINNTFNNSLGHAAVIIGYNIPYKNMTITGNEFYNSATSDLYLWEYNNNISNIRVYLNKFLSKGVNESSDGVLENVSYCINNQGNFYNASIASANRGSNDCGGEFIIPANGSSYGSLLTATWKPKAHNIIYYVWISNNSVNWTYIGNSTTNSISIDTTNYPDLRTYRLRLLASFNGYNDTYTYTGNFTIDNTAPSISLTPSENKIIYRPSTLDVSCSASDFNLSSVRISIDGTTLCTGSTACSATYTPTTIGTKTLTCTAVDILGNSRSQSITVTVRSRRTGAGGSGGAPSIIQKDVDGIEEKKQATIPEQSEMLFTHGGEDYALVTTSIEEDKTVFEIVNKETGETIISTELKIGEERTFDLDGDGVDDIRVKLADILLGNATFEIQELPKAAPPTTIKPEEVPMEVKKPRWWIAGVILLMVIVGFAIWGYEYYHRRRFR